MHLFFFLLFLYMRYIILRKEVIFMRYELHKEDINAPLKVIFAIIDDGNPDSEMYPSPYISPGRSPSKHASLHWHDDTEIIYAVDGMTRVFVEGKIYTLSPGEIVLVGSKKIHRTLDAGTGGTHYALIIPNTLCKNIGFESAAYDLEKPIADEKAAELVITIVKEMAEKNEYYQDAVKIAVSSLFLYIMRKHEKGQIPSSEKSQKGMHKVVKETIEHIKQNIYKSISVDELAQMFGLSKFYYCREFKKITGYTIVNYINLQKCMKARNLILSSEYKIKEIAQMTGFENMSYFSRTYKKYMGCLPSQEID